MGRDPEAAREKLLELEKDRAVERATLKHRGSNKWNKEIRQFASRNPELRKIMDEHLRYGRELKKKYAHRLDSDSDESSPDEDGAPEHALSNEDILKVRKEMLWSR